VNETGNNGQETKKKQETTRLIFGFEHFLTMPIVR
jgi:hypothetical protein